MASFNALIVAVCVVAIVFINTTMVIATGQYLLPNLAVYSQYFRCYNIMYVCILISTLYLEF